MIPRELPEVFCWSKMGTEAGQSLETILKRKELERLANEGIFAWGVGNALGQSLDLLKKLTSEPTVVFTPMRSKAKQMDRSPKEVFLWLTCYDACGREVPLPEYSLLTSRGETPTGKKRSHYALLCKKNESLLADIGGEIDGSLLVNLVSGKRLGHSQVTSVVRRAFDSRAEFANYRISFTASLMHQGQVRLATYISIKASDLEPVLEAAHETDLEEWKNRVSTLKAKGQVRSKEKVEVNADSQVCMTY